ncbi:MAG: bifunctional homocysteine S-methyltransferase/methylenetetrahydrofolate reductase [Fibrobacteria bacterium]|nr:bifunctional homocysteine S-methyltransferase/methylenetetrahydrofolate reductase [Fibrobacteria bacterium]
MKSILEKLKESPLVFDGAMGTMIYERGVFINTCYDELCLSKPDLILEIHRDYVEAGADVLETNTFGANRVKLKGFGLVDKIKDINSQAVSLAKEAAENNCYVAGAMGPCVSSDQQIDDIGTDVVSEAFKEQATILVEAGADFIHLESFSRLDELLLAIDAVAQTGLDISASFSVNEEGVAHDGKHIKDYSRALELHAHVDIVGINCGMGPAGAYDALKTVIPICSKPVVVMPNAGLPRDIGGRVIYLTSPEYFMKYAKRFIQLGARGIGGCCGTTPEHINKAVKGIRNLSEVKQYKNIKVKTSSDVPVGALPAVPLELKSPFSAKLARGEMVTSIEVLPPKSMDITKTLEKIKYCYDKGADAVNMPDGPRASARLSNMMTGVTIQNQTGIEVIPHFCCRDRNIMGMQGDIMAGFAAGIKNLLCVTGDPPNIGDYPEMSGVFDLDSIGLVQMVNNLNHGFDLGGHPISPSTAIVIGVAANPCAVDLPREINRFVQKVEAGAEYAITQPVFDAEALIEFMEKIDAKNQAIPIIAGVWPMTSYKNAQFMATEVPGVVVPQSLLERMSKCTSKEDNIKTGIEIARETCEKIKSSVQGFQVSAPFENVVTALKVLGLD